MSDRCRSHGKAEKLQALAMQQTDCVWTVTERPDQATELAEAAALIGFDRVVAMGGDGTVHQVINGLMRINAAQRPTLGVVPLGSGNDFAFASRISMDAEVAMRQVLQGQIQPIDVAQITDDKGRRSYFINSAGMFLDAAINMESHRIQRIHGFAMYLMAALRSMVHHLAPTHVRITVDGQVYDRDLLLLALGNGPREGGGFVTNPAARNDDGQLDVVMIEPCPRLMMGPMLLAAVRGRHGWFKWVTFGRFQSMTINASSAVPVHLDGELWADYEADVRELDVQIIPSAIGLLR